MLPPPANSRKRRQSSEPTPTAPPAQRQKAIKTGKAATPSKVTVGDNVGDNDDRPAPYVSTRGGATLARADTNDAVETLRNMAKRSPRGGGGGGGAKVAEPRASSGEEAATRKDRGASANAVTDVLRDAMCGLCSELLLDAGVLPCSHSFCKLCWAERVEEKGPR